MKKFEKFILLYLITAITSFFIYVTTEFVLSNIYQNILISIEVLILVIFSLYLIKNIKTKKIDYSLNSFSAYIGIVGINLILFGLVHFGLIYPLSYTLHKATKILINEEMVIMNKIDYVSSTQFLKKYRYEFWLQSSNFSKVLYLTDNQLSEKDYNKIHMNDIIIVNVEKSFFGYIINKLEYTTKD